MASGAGMERSLEERVAVLEALLTRDSSEIGRIDDTQRDIRDQVTLDRSVFIAKKDFGDYVKDATKWREKVSADLTVLRVIGAIALAGLALINHFWR